MNENKRLKVAIVGNGFILQVNPKGSEIDKCDVVIRIHPQRHNLIKEISGRKIDIYACEPTTYSRYFDKGKVWMLTPEVMSPENIAVFRKKFGFSPDYIDFPYSLEREYRIMAKAQPSENMAPTTGAKTVIHALKLFSDYDIYLYGFDFYRFTPNVYYYEKQKGTWQINNGIPRRYKIERDYIINLTKKHNNLFFVEK